MAAQTSDKPRICHTVDECFEAGQRLARERGDKPSPTQIARYIALLRPHIRRDPAA